MNPPAVLVIAYACAPFRGSEWGLSWNFVRTLAASGPVWVITHEENRTEIEAFNGPPTAHPIHFEFVTCSRLTNWFGSLCYPAFNVQYYLWQFAAARAARRLHGQVRFDLAQHVSLMRWWMPSAATTLAPLGVKVIFGPVVGGELMPKRFRRGIGWAARLAELERRVAVGFWSLDPLLARSIRRASLVLAGTPQTAQRLATYHPQRMELCGGGVTSQPAQIEAARQHRATLPADRPFRIVSSGGLSYFRGVDLALRAFAKANLPNAEYVHASDGPQRARLEALARELGIADRVKFLGDQPHAGNVKVVGTADVYVHTVLRDSMGLIPDALALGIPVLTLDHNTMALLVEETVGHKVPIGPDTTPQAVIDDLAQTMKRWHADPALRARLGANAIAYSERFTPQGRARQFRLLQASVLAQPPSTADVPVQPVSARAPGGTTTA